MALAKKFDKWIDKKMDKQTDNGQSDIYVALCFAGAAKVLPRILTSIMFMPSMVYL